MSLPLPPKRGLCGSDPVNSFAKMISEIWHRGLHACCMLQVSPPPTHLSPSPPHTHTLARTLSRIQILYSSSLLKPFLATLVRPPPGPLKISTFAPPPSSSSHRIAPHSLLPLSVSSRSQPTWWEDDQTNKDSWKRAHHHLHLDAWVVANLRIVTASIF